MRKAISLFLSLSLFATIAVSSLSLRTSADNQTRAGQSALVSDVAGGNLVGQGSGGKKFVNGVVCGAGAVLTVAGFAGGLFTGGLTAVLAGAAFASTTAVACAEAFSS